MPLNKEQQSVFLQIIDFINGPAKAMDLSGRGGTGKTYLIGHIVNNIMPFIKNEKIQTIAVTATTNKAAAVLNGSIPGYDQNVGTIYTYMNLRLSENYTTGATSIVPTQNWEVKSNTLIIIDECSMVNADLFHYLQIGIDSSCKILYVGDRNQLSPVKEDISPIYSQGYPQANLTTSVRNAGQQALMDLCEQARQTVLTGVFTPIIPVPGVIDIVDGLELKGIMEREFHKEAEDKRIIAYTNARVVQYNTFVRELRCYTEPFVVGEILSNNTSTDVGNKTRLYTDQLVRLKRVCERYEDHSLIKGVPIPMIRIDVEDLNTRYSYNVSVFANPDDRQKLSKHFVKHKNWPSYFKIKNEFPDLRPIAASTTHKAQGSTYDRVVIDLSDIGTCTQVEQTARMQYVAVSRAKSRIFIRGELPPRYFK